jgi:hypothetical protein
VADAYVHSSYPKTNFGDRSRIRSRGAPEIRGLVTFDLGDVTGSVSKATLRLFVKREHPGVSIREIDSSAWTEMGVTWRSAPAMGAVLGSSGRLSAGEWVEFDVTKAVTDSANQSFAVTSSSNDIAALVSREFWDRAAAPTLIVVSG